VAKSEHLPRLIALLDERRWAALATIGMRGKPEASMVAYVVDEKLDALYLHLSQLAAHSRNLLRNPDASLVVSEADSGDGDPQQMARVSLFGRVSCLQRDEPGYEEARCRYLHRLPTAEPLFDFADFRLFRFAIYTARFVGGFAQAHSYDAADLAEALRERVGE
jgi:hypothetical protein